MTLMLIKTHQHAFIVNTVDNEDAAHMTEIFGNKIHLFAKRIFTPGNPHGTMIYSDHYSSTPVVVCKKSDVVFHRPLNAEERDIYNKLSHDSNLGRPNREYLIEHYLE